MPRAPPSWQPPRPPRTFTVRGRTSTVPIDQKSPGTDFGSVPGLFSFADLLEQIGFPWGLPPTEDTGRVDFKSNTGRNRYDRCF